MVLRGERHFGITRNLTEFIDQKNWKLNFEIIKDFFGNNNDGYLNLLEYEWKFHGVGFHYISPIKLMIVIINMELLL